MNTAAAIAEMLEREGVQYLFSFPVHPLIDECAKREIRPIVARTERALVNMADGYSRMSCGRQIGVAVAQYGPGAENAYAGVAQAFADGSPLIFLPGGFPRGRTEVLPNFDAAANYRGVSKWSAVIRSPDHAEPLIRRAFTIARCGRPAPVVVELPMDVAGLDAPAPDYSPGPRPVSTADPSDVREAVRILRHARRPVLHVGQGVLWAQASDELREFAELAAAPVMTTLPGKSGFPEDHPLSIGNGGFSGSPLVAQFLEQSDVVFGIGCSFTSSLFAAPIPRGKTVVHLTNQEADIDKDVPANHALLGDARLTLRQLCDELRQAGPRHDDRVTSEIRDAKDRWLAEWQPKLTSQERPINPYRVVHELQRLVDLRRTVITHDSGTPRDQLAPFWQSRIPRGYIGWGKSTQLGSSLGFAMGAKLAAPDKLVIQFLGDTAFGMCGMDYETAVRERIPILVVLVNNGLMGGYDRYIPVASRKYRSRFLTGHYTRIAEGLGLVAERVTEPTEIVAALQRGLSLVAPNGDPASCDARPALIEFITREETQLNKPW